MLFRRVVIFICILFASITVCNTAIAQTRNNDSAARAQKAYYENLRKERQRKLDSTRTAQKKYYDSLKVARQQILDSTRKAQKRYNDSMQAARKHVMDSTIAARKQYYDSLKVVRQQKLDSMKAERQRVSDSLKVIRDYRSSARFKDSVAAIRQARIDSTKAVRTAYFDSVKRERQRVTDSVVAVRKAYIDSIKVVQKRRSDSLAVIRTYKSSKRYKDSVQVVRQMRLDSIKAVRTAYFDSVATERKRVNDSVVADRKAKLDSMKAVRTAYLDSVKTVRKARADSLAVIKAKREKDLEIKKKDRENRQQLAFELKIKKKREAWSNEKMLKKKWSLPRRILQNTFTKFNYYFNADLRMDEALANMLRFRQENYDSLLALYPFDPDRDSAVLAPDMDSIIQKASVGIQIHDPRTSWGDDLYLLLGQAYYYKGDYKNAANSFKYVVSLRDKRKKKKNNNRTKSKTNSIVEEEDKGVLAALKHRSVHNEAILWLARTYTEEHREDEAEAVLDLVENDPNFPESLKGRLELEKAYIYLSKGDYDEATSHLTAVANDKKLPNWIRERSAYISGQLYMQQRDYTAAIAGFKKTLDMNPNIDMDFYSRKNIAYSMMLGGGDGTEAIALLKKVLKDGKYRNYYEQVYYVLGRLAAKNGETEEAIGYLTDGISSAKSTDQQKGLSYAMLGNIYYNSRQYELAKSSYDSAANFATSVPDDTLMSNAIKRGGVLENLTTPLNIIKNNDSLLALSLLNEKDSRSVVRKYIKMLEKRRADSIFNAQNAGLNTALQNSANVRKGSYANWYFSNPKQLQKGFNDFKSKWGSRPLADDWRRSASGGFGANDGGNTADNANNLNGNVEYDANGIPTEAALLSYIPNTTEAKDSLLLQIRRAYVDAATSYIQDLEDYSPAIATLDTLNVRFANHEYKDEELYLRYLIALRKGDVNQTKQYQERLLKDYDDSKWTDQIRPDENAGGVNTSMSVANFYDETYQLLMQRRYQNVLVRSRAGQKKYNDKVYQNRFVIMEAISLAGIGSYREADSLLTQFMSTNPTDSLRGWAEAILNYINTNKNDTANGANASGGSTANVNAPSSSDPNKRVLIPLAPKPTAAPAAYTYAPKDKHYVVFSFVTMEQRAMGVKAAITDFNKFKFSSLGLSTDISMLNPTNGVIVSESFSNVNQAKIYLNALRGTSQIFREYQSGEYNIFMISEQNYQKLLADKDVKAYLQFYNSKYK